MFALNTSVSKNNNKPHQLIRHHQLFRSKERFSSKAHHII